MFQPDVAEAFRLVAAPALLAAILLAHLIYFRRHRHSDGQQVITLVGIDDVAVLVSGDRVSIDPHARCSTSGRLPLRPRFAGFERRSRHAAAPYHVADTMIDDTLICADDLVCDGHSRFLAAVKVGGDLIVNGHATFAGPVIVNGVLKIIGGAHFAGGILAKRDTFAAGLITIGSADAAGWAALGEIALGDRLDLNGELVARVAVPLGKAA